MRVVAVLLATVGLVPTWSGAHHLDMTLKASFPSEGNEYLSMRVSAPEGDDWQVRLTDTEGTASMIGRAVFSDGGAAASVRWAGGRTFVARTAPTGGVVDSRPEPLIVDEWDGFSASSSGDGATASTTIFFASDGDYTGTFELWGDEGVSLVSHTRGPASLLHDEQLHSFANARAGDQALDLPFVGCVACPYAGAAVFREHTIDIQHRLFGWYRLGGGVSGYDTEEGPGDDDSFLWGLDPGSYRFHAEVAVESSPTWLLWADVVPT